MKIPHYILQNEENMLASLKAWCLQNPNFSQEVEKGNIEKKKWVEEVSSLFLDDFPNPPEMRSADQFARIIHFLNARFDLLLIEPGKTSVMDVIPLAAVARDNGALQACWNAIVEGSGQPMVCASEVCDTLDEHSAHWLKKQFERMLLDSYSEEEKRVNQSVIQAIRDQDEEAIDKALQESKGLFGNRGMFITSKDVTKEQLDWFMVHRKKFSDFSTMLTDDKGKPKLPLLDEEELEEVRKERSIHSIQFDFSHSCEVHEMRFIAGVLEIAKKNIEVAKHASSPSGSRALGSFINNLNAHADLVEALNQQSEENEEGA